jgi:hypothetical protein
MDAMELRHKNISAIIGLLIVLVTNSVIGGVTVLPKHIFMDASHKMVPLSVRNTSDTEVEIYIRLIYGYITTDDTGKVILTVDSTATDSTSAVQWIKPYPVRFVLGGGESQTVRLLASPPPSLAAGEYWGRVMVTIYQRGTPPSQKDKNKMRGGMSFANEIGLPIYYRSGKVNTGLDPQNFSLQKIDNELRISLDLERSGNASFNGTRVIRIRDREGNTVRTLESENLVVFNKYKLRETIKVSDLPAGGYNIEMEITSKRKDVSGNNLLSCSPIRLSGKIELP